MFCRNCGKELPGKADFCTSCGVRPLKGKQFCNHCGAETRPNAEICIKCGVKLGGIAEGKSWIVALLLSFFLGGLGIDRFYLGYTGLGILKLFVTILTMTLAIATLGILWFGPFIWWLIDLILIATNNMKDARGQALVKETA